MRFHHFIQIAEMPKHPIWGCQKGPFWSTLYTIRTLNDTPQEGYIAPYGRRRGDVERREDGVMPPMSSLMSPSRDAITGYGSCGPRHPVVGRHHEVVSDVSIQRSPSP